MRPFQRLLNLLKLDRREIAAIYLYALFSGLITLILPLGVQAIIGMISGGKTSSSWVLLILAVTGATALSGILTMMQLSVIELIQQRIFTRSAFDLAWRLPKIRYESLHGEYAPELVNRFFDTQTLQKGLPKILMDFSSGVLQILFGLVLLAFYHPFFIFFSAMLVLIVTLIFHWTYPQGLATSLKESKYKYEMASWLEEIARSIGTFKLSGNSELPLRKTDDLASTYLDARKKHFGVLMRQFGSMVAFKTLVTAGLLVLGSILVIENRINLGQFVAAEIVVILVLASVEKLILTLENLYDVLAGLEKLGSLADLPTERLHGAPLDVGAAGTGVAVNFQSVSYTFPGSPEPALENVSISVAAGEKVCICGYNSSGKSTLLRLATGVYENFQGALLFNKIPVQNLDLASLRARIGEHFPDETIFKGTLFENISMGHPSVSLSMTVEAVEKTGLSNFVHSLPHGYETVLSPQGKNLSKGVVSKIILARSIVNRPALLAVEEPFAFFEREERERLSSLLADPAAPWTLLIVSNDPVLAAKCDRVVVMQAGHIVQQGSFEEIRQGVHYQEVFK